MPKIVAKNIKVMKYGLHHIKNFKKEAFKNVERKYGLWPDKPALLDYESYSILTIGHEKIMPRVYTNYCTRSTTKCVYYTNRVDKPTLN